jgi:hypothetical protein
MKLLDLADLHRFPQRGNLLSTSRKYDSILYYKPRAAGSPRAELGFLDWKTLPGWPNRKANISAGNRGVCDEPSLRKIRGDGTDSRTPQAAFLDPGAY